jgi:hypothetical protein
MKWFKFVFVVVLVVLSGSCSLFGSKTNYYYVVHSGCTYHGGISFFMPNTQTYQNWNIPINSFVSKAYGFEKGEMLWITASVAGESIDPCRYLDITVTIMKGGTEGSVGSGGTVWKTVTDKYEASVSGHAD